VPSLEGRERQTRIWNIARLPVGGSSATRAKLGIEGIVDINRLPCIIYASICFVNVRKYVTSSVGRWSFREGAEAGKGGEGAETPRCLVLSNENLGRPR